ncbi:tyrosine-protein phosphatase non-receptor type substrate 1-like [Mustelus asterias]
MGAVRKILKLCLFVLGPVVGLNVTQFPSVLSLLTGQTARMNCTLIPGEERVYTMKYYWCRARDNLNIRSNGSKNCLKKNSRLSPSEGSLVIRQVILDDSDTYHCVVLRKDPLPLKSFVGEGTKLNIQAKPEISLSADPQKEIVGLPSLICLAAGFFPCNLSISWIVEGVVFYQTEPGSLTVNSDSSYNLSSRLQITDAHWDQGAAVICEVQHITLSEPVRISFSDSRGVSKYYYFSLLGLILIVPVCLWIIKSLCCKLKNGKDSSIHGKNVGNQINEISMHESANESSIYLSSETQHYASIHIKNPSKRKQKRELKKAEQDQTTEYAVLKVRDKNNPFYEDSAQYSTVGTSNRRQTANYNATTYASLKK